MDLVFDIDSDFLLSLLLVSVAFIICGLAIIRINNYSLPLVYPTPRPLQVGGWLIVIAILQGLAVISYFFELFNLGIWNDTFWALPAYGPMEFARSLLYALLVVFTLCGAAFSLFLLIKRRDIFPKVLTYYSVISTGIYIIDMIIKRLTSPPRLEFIVIAEWTGIAINLLITILIIRYVNRSVRAQETFVLPHPSLVDHEEPQFGLKD